MKTLERFLSYLRDELRYSPHTVDAYRRDISAWLAHYGESRPVEAATQADIRRFIAHEARKGQSIATLRRRTVSLRSLFRFLMRSDGLTVNPVSGLNPGRLPKRLPVNVRKEETEDMLNDLMESDESFGAFRDRLILEMLYQTGMRCSELTGLRDDRVDSASGLIRVLGKRDKERIIPFGNSLRELIDEYRELRSSPDGPGAAAPGDPFFVRSDGRPLYRKLVYNVVHKAMADAGVHAQRMSPHVMRHSFATDMLSGGASLTSVQQLLGHASLATTQIYTHISLSELQKNYAAAHPRAKHHNHNIQTYKSEDHGN